MERGGKWGGAHTDAESSGEPQPWRDSQGPLPRCAATRGVAVRGAGGPGQAGVLRQGAGRPSQGPMPCRPAPTGPTDCGWREEGLGLPSPGAHAPCSLPAFPPSGHGQRLLPACWTASPFRPKRAERHFLGQSMGGAVGDTGGPRGATCWASMGPGYRLPCRVLNRNVHPVPSMRGPRPQAPPTPACCGSPMLSPVFPAQSTC